MEIKNKKTGYIFEISDNEGKKLITEKEEDFEPLNKKIMPKQKKPKNIKEKVIVNNPLEALKKEQIIQELQHLCVAFNPKANKKELIEILKKAGGV